MSEKIFSTKTSRLVMAIVCLAFGLYMIIIAPILVQQTLEEYLTLTVPEGPPPKTFLRCVVIPIFWYTYRGIGVLAGVILVVISYSVWKGVSWTWPVAVVSIALATIFCVQPFVQYMAHVNVATGGMAPSIPTMFFGVGAFLIVLLLPRSDKMEKLARFTVYTLLGVEGGLVSTYIVQSTMKNLLMGFMAASTSNADIILDPMIAILGFEWPLQVFTTVLLIMAIFLLAKRNPKGWWYALIAGTLAIVANFVTQFIRMQTIDFFIAGTIGVLIVISLNIPAFKKRLIDIERKAI